MNPSSLPGAGDYGRLPIISAIDPRCYDTAEEEGIEAIADALFTVRSESPAWISDAMNDLEQPEIDALAAAYRAGDQIAAGRVLFGAINRVLQRDARKEAEIRMEKMLREDEEDAARERMEA